MNLLFVFAVLLGVLVGAMLLVWRRTRSVGFLMLVISFSAASYAVLQTRRYERGFARVVAGCDEEQVLEFMGSPKRISDGTLAVYGYPRSKSEIREDVKKEFWFYCLYAPEAWTVSFGKDGKVLSTDHLKG